MCLFPGSLFCSTIYASVFMSLRHCFHFCNFIIQFEIRICHAFSFVAHFQDCFGTWVFFWVPGKFRYFFYFCEKCHRILIEIAVILQIPLDRSDILTLIFQMHEHQIYFHLLVASSTSFIIVLQSSGYRSFTFLFKFIPKYFIDANENEIVLISSTVFSIYSGVNMVAFT